MNYKIKGVSEITNTPPSKIRYYEQEGLLPCLKRDQNNIRIFSDKDIEMINLINCLRTLGMPIKRIKHNINTIVDKKSNLSINDILLEHKLTLEDQVRMLEKHISNIENKINTLN